MRFTKRRFVRHKRATRTTGTPRCWKHSNLSQFLVVVACLWMGERGIQCTRAHSHKSLSTSAFLGLSLLVTAAAVANAEEPKDSKDNDSDGDDFVCGVYLALSTIPGTGLGMYAGPKGFRKDELITKFLGDHVVAIPDLKHTQSDTGLYSEDADELDLYFLWDQYTWNKNAFGINLNHMTAHDNEIASPGFGAAANSFMDFVNVDEGGVDFGLLPPTSQEDNYTIHRSRDPGAGAFTPFHTRKAWANQDIKPFSELWVSYGNDWFLDRKWRLGVVPVKGDHGKAERLWRSYHEEFLDGNEESELQKVYRDFWTEVVADKGREIWKDESYTMASLPQDPRSPLYEEMLEHPGGYVGAKQETMGRTQEWLAENGICADAVRIGRSSLPSKQAGHGAFSQTTFKQGETVMVAPLIHIPDKAILDTFFKPYSLEEFEDYYGNDDSFEGFAENGDFDRQDNRAWQKYQLEIGSIKTGEQLLMNYAFGHRDSTMLLSPYGPGVQLINHNQTLKNVELRWADPERSNHVPEVLEQSIRYIMDHYHLGTKLAFEVVATRDILPGEELFLDYGDEWEAAWQKHVDEWEPMAGSEGYVSATDLNTLEEYTHKPLANLMPHKDQANPYPPTVRLMMNAAWVDDKLRSRGDNHITDEVMFEEYSYEPVEMLMKTGATERKYQHYENKTLFDMLHPSLQQELEGNYIREDVRFKKLVGPDPSLYRVVVAQPYECDKTKEDCAYAPGVKRRTAVDVPRRALKFEDRSYTQDQFLPNAFREYIRIPDELFPEAWKNMKTDEEKKAHYEKYRNEDYLIKKRRSTPPPTYGPMPLQTDGDDDDEEDEKEDGDAAVDYSEITPRHPIGTMVSKRFGDGNIYEGEVVGYDKSKKEYYQILYEDGDTEDMDEEDMNDYRKIDKDDLPTADLPGRRSGGRLQRWD